MELVYFWVREYKNIKNQGFNFSGKWEFKYEESEKGENGILSYKVLENPTPDGFFGENIVSVTGIVGTNGSGKSSLINAMLSHFSSLKKYSSLKENSESSILTLKVYKTDDNITEKTGFIIYFDNDTGKYNEIGNSAINGIKISGLPKPKDSLFQEKNLDVLYRPNLSNSELDPIIPSYIDLSFNAIFNEYYIPDSKRYQPNPLQAFNFKEMREQIRFCSYFYQNDNLKNKLIKNGDHKDSVLNFIPKKITFRLKESELNQNFDPREHNEHIHKAYNLMHNIYYKLKNAKNELENDEFTLKLIGDKKSYRERLKKSVITCLFNRIISHIEEFITYTFKYENDYINLVNILNEIDIIISLNPQSIYNNVIFDSIMDCFMKLESQDGQSHSGFWTSSHIEVKTLIPDLKLLNKNFKLFLKDCIPGDGYVDELIVPTGVQTLHKFLEIYNTCIDHLKDQFISITWDEKLSDGEKSLLNIFSRLALYPDTIKIYKSITIYFDEPDLTFHPEWQRQILTYLLGFFTDYDDQKVDQSEILFKDKKIQIILTTHSPYILSDLPRGNVIVMDECKVSKKQHIKLTKTFGANIHELLSSDFFMENTIGEFAYQKIKKVISLIQENNIDEHQEEINFIIENIGEPIIANKLKSMYEEKLPNAEKKKLIDEKIKKLITERDNL